MKKNSTFFGAYLNNDTYKLLRILANERKQSMTKYLEACITNQINFKAFNDIQEIINIYIDNYNALNSAISNLNQLTHNTHINNLPQSKEIINTIQSVKDYSLENRKISKLIITKLDEINRNKTKILKKYNKMNKGKTDEC